MRRTHGRWDRGWAVTGSIAATILVFGCSERASDVAAVASQPDPEAYRRMCGPALTAAKEFGRRLRTSTVVDAAPAIVSTGPPVRIRCQIRARDGRPGLVTADIRCMDAFDRLCVGPVSASLNGVIVQGPGRGPAT